MLLRRKDFEFFSFFDFVYAINVGKKPWFSMLNDMQMVSVIVSVGEDLGSKLVQ
jgi:hypothetical protein